MVFPNRIYSQQKTLALSRKSFFLLCEHIKLSYLINLNSNTILIKTKHLMPTSPYYSYKKNL